MDGERQPISAWWVAACLAACSSSESLTHGRPPSGAGGTSSVASGSSTTGGPIGVGGSPSGAGGGVISVPDASVTDAPLGDASCAASTTEARLVPLDLFIMLDRSGSMTEMVGNGETRWTAVTKAIGSFVQQPAASGLGVGLNYFGLSAGKSICSSSRQKCMSDADCAPGCGPCAPVNIPGWTSTWCQGAVGDLGLDECDVANYAKAETPIASLPGNAQPILDSLSNHEPNSNTPTSAALQGAVNFSRQWATSHLGHVVVNVFATDGVPMSCDQDPAHIGQIAADGFAGTPSIRTFVIGVGSEAGSAAKALLDRIAMSGGTTRAFLVTDTDVNAQFLDALNKIRGAALACAYELPDGMGRQLDYGRVNVSYTPGGTTTATIIPKVANLADCANRDGWYYDDDAHPTRILVCDATCQKLSADSKGKVEIQVGCATIIAPPPK